MTASDNPTTTHSRPTVLLVDDSRVMRKAMCKILGDEFELIEAEDGEEGWKQLTSHPEIEVVISDIEMPGLDGYGFLDRVRNFEDIRIRKMPVIIITGAEDEETRLAALELGATDFIIKPFDHAQLLARTRAQAKFTEASRDLEETTISLKSDTTQDPLTGLKSRRFFLQRGEQDIAYCKRHNQDMALLRVDIDKFRRLYADYGDEIVDDVLIWVAHSLKDCARTEDTVARVGGSSFSIMAPSTNPEEAMVLADRLCAVISSKPFEKDDVVIPMTISIGLTTLANHPDVDIESLLKVADENMREVRRRGGGAAQVENTEGANAFPAIEVLEDAVAAPEDDKLQAESVNIGNFNLDESEELVIGSDLNQSDGIQTAVIELTSAAVDSSVLSNVEPHLWSLMARLLPLLEYCDKKLELGIGAAIETIRQKTKNQKIDT